MSWILVYKHVKTYVAYVASSFYSASGKKSLFIPLSDMPKVPPVFYTNHGTDHKTFPLQGPVEGTVG